MNNYITVLIDKLHKNNKKGHLTTWEVHRVKEFQETILIQITDTEMIIIAMT